MQTAATHHTTNGHQLVTKEQVNDHNIEGNTTEVHKSRVPRRLYSSSEPPSLESFRKLVSQTTDTSLYPLANQCIANIPIYNLTTLSPLDTASLDTLQDEWHHILQSGPGVFVLKNFFPPSQRHVIDNVNDVFATIITSEASSSKGDHFAGSGNNSRIWNSFQKHALASPSSFAQYYSNPWLPAVAEAWLGVHYQTTAQVNIVRPGGKPQVSHRDYHLGFQSAEECRTFPRATQTATQYLTLQGAVAHTDMPAESGPTRFLPFSQRFEEGYMAYRLKEFQDFFDRNWVSVPLGKGDAVFFNPGLHHAAGENTSSDIERSANLLQISSAFGRTMESIDTLAIIESVWEGVKKIASPAQRDALLKAIGQGYPFPTNLDRRPPAPGGLAPQSEIEVLRIALTEDWSKQKVVEAIKNIKNNSLP